MTQSALTLLVAAACLFGVGLFALAHRRDAMGAVLAVVLALEAVTCALVGFAQLAPSPAAAAQLEAFAIVAELTGVLFAAAGVALAAVLRRRTAGQDLLERAPALPGAAAGPVAEEVDRDSALADAGELSPGSGETAGRDDEEPGSDDGGEP